MAISRYFPSGSSNYSRNLAARLAFSYSNYGLILKSLSKNRS
jgi:hypothetical protein